MSQSKLQRWTNSGNKILVAEFLGNLQPLSTDAMAAVLLDKIVDVESLDHGRFVAGYIRRVTGWKQAKNECEYVPTRDNDVTQ